MLKRVAAALLVLLAAPAAAEQRPEQRPEQRVAAFNVGGVDLEVPLPAGYCLPSGPQVAIVQALAAIDTVNVTHLTFVPCDVTDATRHIILKTPRSALLANVGRTELLDSLGVAMASPETAAFLASGKINDDAERSMATVLNTDVDMTGALRPFGRDDVCAYLGGIMRFQTAGQDDVVSMAMCLTAVGGRVLAVNWYDEDRGAAGVAAQLAAARRLALAVRTRPAP